jgi:hypothetical protein
MSPAPPHDRPWSLVTGASSGIGAAYARALARDGHALVLVARRRDRLGALASDLERTRGVAVRVLEADLGTPAGIDAVVADIASGPPLSFVVQSAGFGTRDCFADLPEARTVAMVNVHAVAPTRIARAALPGMIARQRGALVMVSSLGAFFTTARYTTYSATKAFLNQLCVGLAAEVAPHGIRVQALCPGLTRTEFLDTADYADFRYDQVPDWAWMTADAVVAESLAALPRGPVVVVPGRLNRAFVRVLTAPGLGPLLMSGLGYLAADAF